jgi:outer membrane protein TolC
VLARIVTAFALGFVLGIPAMADPKSDLFQPDFFRTRPALKGLTPGLKDPFDQACPLPPNELSLVQAVDIALCRNPATRTAWASAHLEAAALGSSESAWLPTITGTDQETRALGTHTDDFDNPVNEPQNTNDATLALSWTLYDFGGRTGKIRSSRYLLSAAAYSANSSVQQTVFNVMQAYYGQAASEAAVAAAVTAEQTAAQSVEIVRAIHEGGAATLGDVLQAETAYDQAVLATSQARAALQTAVGTLNFQIGIPSDQKLKVAVEKVPPEVPALTARLEDLMGEAARQRPDLLAARNQVSSAVEDITVARALGRPSIALSASRDRVTESGTDPNTGLSYPKQNYGQIGLTLTVPLFTGFSVGYGVRQSQATLETREVNAEQVRLQVTLDVWKGYYGLQEAIKQVTATSTWVKTAETNEEVALGRFKAGVGTILDLLTAQTAWAAAQQARISAELAWETGRAQLVLALGRLYGAEPLNSEVALP